MALTDTEQKSADAAELEELIAELMSPAPGQRQPRALSRARRAARIQGAHARAAAARARHRGAHGRYERAYSGGTARAAYGRNELAPLTNVFADAAAIAASGKKELLFPRLAATASTMLQVVTELKDAAEKVKAQVGNVNELGDVPLALETVQAALVKLQAGIDAVR